MKKTCTCKADQVAVVPFSVDAAPTDSRIAQALEKIAEELAAIRRLLPNQRMPL